MCASAAAIAAAVRCRDVIETGRLGETAFVIVVVVVVATGANGRGLERHIVRVVQSLEQTHVTAQIGQQQEYGQSNYRIGKNVERAIEIAL